MTYWTGKKVAVTGAGGFVGKHLLNALQQRGAKPIAIVYNKEKTSFHDVEVRAVDLMDAQQAKTAIHGADVVINCAAILGGIQHASQHPGSIFRDNMMLFINVLEAARLEKVERFVTISSAGVYPLDCSVPTPEEEGMSGQPDPAVEGYGWAKRMQEYMSQAYAREYGMRIAIVRPANGYGPENDKSPSESGVIPLFIERVLANEPITLFGTGAQTRSFLYIDDFIEGILLAAEKYAVADPINIGSSREVSMKELVALVGHAVGVEPRVTYDATKPEGHLRRSCDTTKMREKLGWEPRVNIEEGVKRTVAWYKTRK